MLLLLAYASALALSKIRAIIDIHYVKSFFIRRQHHIRWQFLWFHFAAKQPTGVTNELRYLATGLVVRDGKDPSPSTFKEIKRWDLIHVRSRKVRERQAGAGRSRSTDAAVFVGAPPRHWRRRGSFDAKIQRVAYVYGMSPAKSGCAPLQLMVVVAPGVLRALPVLKR